MDFFIFDLYHRILSLFAVKVDLIEFRADLRYLTNQYEISYMFSILCQEYGDNQDCYYITTL